MPYWIISFFFGVWTLTWSYKLPSLWWLLILIPIFISYVARGILLLKFRCIHTSVIARLDRAILHCDYPVKPGNDDKKNLSNDDKKNLSNDDKERTGNDDKERLGNESKRQLGNDAWGRSTRQNVSNLKVTFAKFINSEVTRILKMHLFAFTLGFSWALIYTHWITAWSLPQHLEGKEIVITGHISSVPIIRTHSVSFEMRTATIAGTVQNTKLKLNWYGEYPSLYAGDKWQLVLRLRRPHGLANPGGFDKEKHLLVQHIRATGYVVASGENRLLSSKVYHYPLTRLRQMLITKMEQALANDKLAPIIIAFVSGAEDKITPHQWQVMRNTGTSYLVAIAGLHIGLVASVAFIFVQFLWRLSRRLPLILPAKEAGIILGLVWGFIYGMVSGFSIPAQRSLVMLVIFSVVTLSRRRGRSWYAWLWSLLVVLIINPLAVLTMGFWLSFSAVAAIIYVTTGRLKQIKTYLGKFCQMQFAVTLALLPTTLLFFQQVSLVSIVANLIAMPSVCLVIVPVCLFGGLALFLPGKLGTILLWCGAKLLFWVWLWLEFLSQYLSSNWHHPIYNGWILLATAIGVLLLLAPRGFPVKILGAIWLMPLFFYVPPKPTGDGEVWFTVLDVGQGLATVIQTKNHVLLYDTGDKFATSDAGTNVILPYLRQFGISRINTLIVSHGDSDHSGGAVSILQALPVTNILTSVPEKFTAFNATTCIAGEHWQWDGVDFSVLSPERDTTLQGNNASCVLKITSGDQAILLTGDIEKSAEIALVNKYSAVLPSTILVAPHHGSNTSSSATFLTAIGPRYVIFPVGYRNRFRFPHKKVVARVAKIGAKLLETAKTGAITFKLHSKSAILNFNYYRQEVKHFWYDN